MNFWKRIFPYLIINVVLSAAVTLIVLAIWDRVQHPQLSAGGNVPATQSASNINSNVNTPQAQPTLPPLDEPVIRIETVIGAGDLATETVQLQRIGENELQLAGWWLEGNGLKYTFPALTLNKNGSVRLYSRAGQSTVIELYWGLESAAWKAGDTITLYDSRSNQRASYTIP
ncbi:MAG: lamin tail domain-containing protein [Bellilinea sp.]